MKNSERVVEVASPLTASLLNRCSRPELGSESESEPISAIRPVRNIRSMSCPRFTHMRIGCGAQLANYAGSATRGGMDYCAGWHLGAADTGLCPTATGGENPQTRSLNGRLPVGSSSHSSPAGRSSSPTWRFE